jgi:hypothetical protein
MQRRLTTLWIALPWTVLAVYCLLIADYARYLDSHLKYVTPHVPRAPEDILGLGFWPTWAAVLILLALAGALAYRRGTRRPVYFLSLVVGFIVASAVDHFLYRTLAEQLLR